MIHFRVRYEVWAVALQPLFGSPDEIDVRLLFPAVKVWINRLRNRLLTGFHVRARAYVKDYKVSVFRNNNPAA